MVRMTGAACPEAEEDAEPALAIPQTAARCKIVKEFF
jgi:hypothetical protein